MVEDIKEILDDYKKLAGEITVKLDNTAEYESWLVIQDYVDEFLNYITNLQKENEIQKKDNESLKKFYNDLVNKYENLIEKYQDYKQRNEKAVEYIKSLKNYRFEFTFDSVDRHEIVGCEKNFVKDLLNILEGGDE